MTSRKLHYLLIALVLGLLPLSANAQAPSPEWETLQPQGEEFTVSLPKSSTSETATFPYHKMELTARVYISATPNGPVLAVASFNGIKSNPALYTDFQRFNSYVDAFKTWFPSKVRPKEAIVKLTQVGNNIFHGYSGREYRMSIGDLSGTVFAYATKKRFYTIISLNTKKDDAVQEKFLSSFYLPDKPADTPAVAAQEASEPKLPDPAATANPEQKPGEGTPRSNPANPNSRTEDDTQPAPQANNQNVREGNPPPGRAPIQGGVLNGKAIYLPLPETPPGDAVGTVMVQVLVDEQGTVISARAVSGPPQLHIVAVNAARLARFTPTTLMGEPVKVSGTLAYNFTR
jgi:Gram-negative bacterial TonB protein C-terminal